MGKREIADIAFLIFEKWTFWYVLKKMVSFIEKNVAKHVKNITSADTAILILLQDISKSIASIVLPKYLPNWIEFYAENIMFR